MHMRSEVLSCVVGRCRLGGCCSVVLFQVLLVRGEREKREEGQQHQVF